MLWVEERLRTGEGLAHPDMCASGGWRAGGARRGGRARGAGRGARVAGARSVASSVVISAETSASRFSS